NSCLKSETSPSISCADFHSYLLMSTVTRRLACLPPLLLFDSIGFNSPKQFTCTTCAFHPLDTRYSRTLTALFRESSTLYWSVPSLSVCASRITSKYCAPLAKA